MNFKAVAAAVLLAGAAHAAIPADAQQVLNDLGASLTSAQARIAAGDVAGAEADLQVAAGHKTTFQTRFAGRLGPVKAFREYSSVLGKLQGELKALKAGGAVGSASTVLPPKPSIDAVSSSGPTLAAKVDTSGRVSSSGPAAAAISAAAAVSGSGPALAGKPAAASGGRNAKLMAEWSAHLDAADAALAQGDFEAAREAAQSASYSQRDCDTSSACRALPEFASLASRTRLALERGTFAGATEAESVARAKAEETATQAAADALETLNSVYSTAFFDGPLRQVRSGDGYGYDGLPATELLATAQRINADAMKLREALGAYRAAGGDTAEHSYTESVAILENLQPSHAATQDRLLRRYLDELKRVDGFYGPDEAAKSLETLAMEVPLVLQINPSHPGMAELATSMADRQAALIEKQQARIDAGVWPKRASFNGPGSAAELEEAALKTLKNDKAWGKNPKRPQDILAVTVQGPWQEAEWNIFGQVVSWRVPMKVAITDAKLKAKGVAQVFDISMVTPQGDAGRKPGLPFDGAWVGGNYYMRIDKLP